jgi:hypothetical protein
MDDRERMINELEARCNDEYQQAEARCRREFEARAVSGLEDDENNGRLNSCLLEAEAALDSCIGSITAQYIKPNSGNR